MFVVCFQSYAGKYVPAIAYRIHVENKGNPKVKINLKGVAIGDGLVDPVNVRAVIIVDTVACCHVCIYRAYILHPSVLYYTCTYMYIFALFLSLMASILRCTQYTFNVHCMVAI